MKKYRLEIPEMVQKTDIAKAMSLKVFDGQRRTKRQWNEISWSKIESFDSWLKPVYFCDECGEEMRGDTVDADRHYHAECLNLEEPEFRETTAEEWAKDLLFLDQATYTYKEIVTESNKAKLDYILRRACEDSFKEGERRAEWKHRDLIELLQDYKHLLFQIQSSRKGNAPERVYCDNSFMVSRIDEQTEKLLAALKSRGF